MDTALSSNGASWSQQNTQPPPAERGYMALFSLKGKTAIIAGAAAGIGLIVAQAYAEAGANVALWYHSNKTAHDRAKEIEKQYGVKARAYQVNVQEPQEVENAVQGVVKEFNGRLDIFVANSGIPWKQGAMTEGTLDHYRKVISTDLDGVYYAARAVAPVWRRQKQEGTDINGNRLENFSYGSFIATGSMSGHIVNVPQLQSAYNAAKAGVIHLCKSLALEWVQFARANSVSPGYISTELTEFLSQETITLLNGKIPMGRQGQAHELAGAYIFLASDASSYATGTDIIIDGGYTSQ
ncbi:sorbitol utilization protein SOU2 [Uncinocarpus reesii 1704]|uniref:Sorbitol utilization protein SOU2 n=1 Tax=Uncinocarpus reesii (strain UAMH 1704) TaxID=336963 RepID=C4JLR8_UNCRE|nr:sorbitol utilization protein SOU2 [Uncinocarpus reesii 1704]EEP78930.1 sorbitol utilization protein SOU2 [Uncinocarpus reesii 1704]